jgi:F-type H+/Na+-transporting ATPase subunit alpha
LMSEVKSKDPGILEAIRTQLEIKPDIEKKLTSLLDSFAKSFS